MLILTTSALPEGCTIKEMYSMILINRAIEVSDKGLIRNLLERERNEYQEAIDSLVALAPKEANAIVSLQVSTAVQQFSDGVYLYLTLAGTPVIYINQ
jgi:uncharacterized protein YbjQ (UPF0145 family)